MFAILNRSPKLPEIRQPGEHPYCLSMPAPRRVELLASQEPRVIRGCIVAEAGVFVDGRGQFTLASLESIVRVMRENDARTGGTKVHFGNVEEIGSHVGRLRNPRLSSTTNRDGQTVRCVRADLEIAPAASRSPMGDLPGYVADLAEHDERALGLSLVILPQRIPAGRGEPDVWLAEAITACDLVDSGAATSSLLSPEPQHRLRLRQIQQTINPPCGVTIPSSPTRMPRKRTSGGFSLAASRS